MLGREPDGLFSGAGLGDHADVALRLEEGPHPWRTSAWSSTSRTVIGSLMLSRLSFDVLSNGQTQMTRVPSPGALDVDASAELRQPFTNAPQAEAVPHVFRRIESMTVVDDTQHQAIGLVDEVNLDVFGAAVPGDVRQGFLGHAEERLLELQGGFALAPDVDLGRDLGLRDQSAA